MELDDVDDEIMHDEEVFDFADEMPELEGMGEDEEDVVAQGEVEKDREAFDDNEVALLERNDRKPPFKVTAADKKVVWYSLDKVSSDLISLFGSISDFT